MRKHVLVRNIALLFLCVSVFGMGSCKKEITQVVNQGFSAIYTIKAGDWQVNSSSTYINVELTVKELDQVILDHGGVSVYISLDGGKTYEAVPEVVGNVAYGSYHYLGKVGIDLSPADNTGTVTTPTGDILAKVVLLDAQPLD
jgi:hypothetical protein